jgi:hypothetical protein
VAVPRALSQLEHAIYQKQTQTLKVIVDGANDRIRAADGKSAITLIRRDASYRSTDAAEMGKRYLPGRGIIPRRHRCTHNRPLIGLACR